MKHQIAELKRQIAELVSEHGLKFFMAGFIIGACVARGQIHP